MLAQLPNFLLPWFTAGILVFVFLRLRLASLPDASAKYLYIIGGVLIELAAIWEALTALQSYSTWFVPQAYVYFTVAQFGALLAGVILVVSALALYADQQQERDDDTKLRESKLSILDNLQRDSRVRRQILDLANLALKEIIVHVPSGAGAVFLMGKDQRQLVLTAAVGLTKQETAALEHLPEDQNIARQSLDLGEPTVAESFLLAHRDGHSVDARFESCLALPLFSGAERLGVLLLLSEQAKAFTRQELRYLAPVAEWLSEKIYAGRLGRELTTFKQQYQQVVAALELSRNKLGDAVKASTQPDPVAAFCRAAVGLAGSNELLVIGVEDSHLSIYGASDSHTEFSESFSAALIDGISRSKPLIINQESTSEQGRSVVVRSSLLVPLPGVSDTSLLFRKEHGPFAVDEHELRQLELYAAIARTLLEQERLQRRDLTSRAGFEKVIQLLRVQDEVPRFAEDTIYFTRLLLEMLPQPSMAIALKPDEKGMHQAWGASRVGLPEMLEGFEFSAHESILADAFLTTEPQFVFGRQKVEAVLQHFQPENRQEFIRRFADRGIPNFMAVLPMLDKQEVIGFAVGFSHEMIEADRREWERLITLAASLYMLRVTLATTTPEESDKPSGLALPQSAANELNNHLSAIVGCAELIERQNEIPGEIRVQLKTIIAQAEKSAALVRSTSSESPQIAATPSDAKSESSLNRMIETVLDRVRIAGDLFMAGGRPREIARRLNAIDNPPFKAESARQLFEAVLDRFGTYTSEDDVLTIATYQAEDAVFMDISRHRKNFPPVERVASFGEYLTAEEGIKNRPQDVFLNSVTGEACLYAVDRSSSSPAFLSFRFPLKSSGSAAGTAASFRVLAVDDQPIILDLISAMCQSLGYSVATAQSGEEGVKKALAGAFDVILTDLAMPDMSGLELARRVHGIRPTTPIILVTGWEATVEPAQLQAAGISQVLYKPFRIEQLTDCIKSVAKIRA